MHIRVSARHRAVYVFVEELAYFATPLARPDLSATGVPSRHVSGSGSSYTGTVLRRSWSKSCPFSGIHTLLSDARSVAYRPRKTSILHSYGTKESKNPCISWWLYPPLFHSLRSEERAAIASSKTPLQHVAAGALYTACDPVCHPPQSNIYSVAAIQAPPLR